MLLHFYSFGLILCALLPALLTLRNLPLFYRLPIVQPPSGKLGAQSKRAQSETSQKKNAQKNVQKKNAQSKAAQSSTPQSEDVVSTHKGNVEASLVQTLPPANCSKVSVLIPARNEEASIGDCLEHVLNSNWPNFDVIVMDDGSEDRTYEICERLAKNDSRLKIKSGRELPMGWNGKQRACWLLALAADGDWLLFIDADVRLSDDAITRLVMHAQSAEIDLLSGFPRQITQTWLEKLLIPLMHFILLGYLPLARMRASGGAEFAAGCGQLFLARRTAYMTCEGHKAICASRHDGIQLPRAFRRQRFKTDVFDASDIASCRMYHDARGVLVGLLKNATEGIGNPRTIWIFTILLSGAAVLPLLSLIVAVILRAPGLVIVELAIATALSYLPRLRNQQAFRQSLFGAVLHPLGVALFLGLQWLALAMQLCGLRVSWRGRQ